MEESWGCSTGYRSFVSWLYSPFRLPTATAPLPLHQCISAFTVAKWAGLPLLRISRQKQACFWGLSGAVPAMYVTTAKDLVEATTVGQMGERFLS